MSIKQRKEYKGYTIALDDSLGFIIFAPNHVITDIHLCSQYEAMRKIDKKVCQ